ncbi:MAG: sugar phosphate isomerase/epimerase family protein [Phycisphaerae bacterium]|nr:sugar phosphate isomerase/epimerase family protein [Phycisphaerae bacterium]
MQTAICHYSFHRRYKSENWTPDRVGEEIKALGVKGIDFLVSLLGSLDGAETILPAAVKNHGLILTGLSLSNNFNRDDAAELAADIEAVKEQIRLAATLGAPVARIFGGHLSPELRADPDAKAAAFQKIVDGLGAVVGEAENSGVVLAIENHGGLPCTAEEQVSVIETIGSDFLKATIDIGNYMACGQEADVATRIAAKHCAYVHFKDFKKVPDASKPWGWGIEPCTVGEGDVDARACIEALVKVGYEGTIALEYEGTEDEVTGVPKSTEFMKSVTPA